MTTFEEIVQATKKALERRDSRRDILAGRLETMIDDAADAARCRTIDVPDMGTVEIRDTAALCSQWSNGGGAWHLEKNWVLCLPGKAPRSFGKIDLSWHDGHDLQYQRGSARDGEGGPVVRPATVAQLRALALALPEVLARLLSETRTRADAETATADDTIAVLPVAE